MAEKVTSQEKVLEEFDIEKNVTVISISEGETTFPRITTIGSVLIPPEGRTRLTRNEIISQVQTGNHLLCGTGNGAHATLFIDDAPTRAYLGFDSEDGTVTQNIFSDEKVKEVFALKTQTAFEEACRNTFTSGAEKRALIRAIKRLKINDYARIRFVEDYTGRQVM